MPDNGHVEVEGNAQHPEPGHDQDRLPVGSQAFGADGQPDAGDEGADADGVEEEQQPRLGADVVEHVVAGKDQQQAVGEVDDEVAQEGVAAQPRIAGGDGDLDAQGGHNEALVQGDAQPEEERRPVGVAQLVRGVDPAHQADQHRQIPGHAGDGDAVDDARLLPHEPVQAEQQAGGHRRDQADGAFPFAGHVLEFLDALHEHAAAAGDHQGQQAAGHRARRRPAPPTRARPCCRWAAAPSTASYRSSRPGNRAGGECRHRRRR